MIGKRMIGKKWGLGPKQAYWLYTAIVRPMLMYRHAMGTYKIRTVGKGELTTI